MNAGGSGFAFVLSKDHARVGEPSVLTATVDPEQCVSLPAMPRETTRLDGREYQFFTTDSCPNPPPLVLSRAYVLAPFEPGTHAVRIYVCAFLPPPIDGCTSERAFELSVEPPASVPTSSSAALVVLALAIGWAAFARACTR